MTKPNRFTIVGDYTYVAKGRVLDNQLGKEFDAELRFKANAGIETSELPDGTKVAKSNLEFVKDEKSGSLWEMVILNNN